MGAHTGEVLESLRGVRVAFMGTPEFAVASLAALHDAGCDICCVVTPPDRPAGRGLKLRLSAVKVYALDHALPLLQPDDLRAPDFVDTLRGLAPDVGVVVAFRKLPTSVWALPRLGTFNLHASLLPQYRGAAPIPRSVMRGEEVSGVTTFLLDERIDTGAILLQSRVPIGPNDTAGNLHDRLMAVGARLVVQTVEGLAQGSLRPTTQPVEERLHSAPKIYREDCRISWQSCASSIHNHIRGLSPHPGAWCRMEIGGKSIEVKLFDSLIEREQEAGEVGNASFTPEGERLAVHCGDGRGRVSIGSIQLPGKRRMPIGEFRRGLHGEVSIGLN